LSHPQPRAAAQIMAARNSADPIPEPRSAGDTRISHSTATSSRPPSMRRPRVLNAITAPPALAPSRRAQMRPPIRDVKALGPVRRPRSFDGVIILDITICDNGLRQRHAAQPAISKRHLQNPVDHEGNGDDRVLFQRMEGKGFLPYVNAHAAPPNQRPLSLPDTRRDTATQAPQEGKDTRRQGTHARLSSRHDRTSSQATGVLAF